MYIMKRFLAFFAVLLFYTSTVSAFQNVEYNSDRFIQLIRHFEKKEVDLKPHFRDERFKVIEDIKGKFTRAAEVKIDGLDDYKRVLNYEKKKQDLPGFMSTYSEELETAEKKYGIPQDVIAAIIGIESGFGLYKGKYNPFNVYVSMYVKNHRSKFALAQLEELLEFADNNKLDVMDLKSSYAGAMSYAQFVPWSLNRWFVGKDLYDMPNNISSVANFLAHYKDVTGTVEKAIYRYNPSTLYQKVVLALADEVGE